VTDELVAFIRARLDEDQASAVAAGSGQRESDECRIEGVGFTIYDEGGHDADQARRIARFDPDRVIRAVEAKRQLLDIVKRSLPGYCDCEAYGHHGDAEDALRLLASEWSDHLGYQEAWRP